MTWTITWPQPMKKATRGPRRSGWTATGHGNYSAAQRCRLDNGHPCTLCRAARSAYMNLWRSNETAKDHGRRDRSARRQAHQALAHQHPDQYRRYYYQALRELELEDGIDRTQSVRWEVYAGGRTRVP